MKAAKRAPAFVERCAALNQSRVQTLILEFSPAPCSGKVSPVIGVTLHVDFKHSWNPCFMKRHPFPVAIDPTALNLSSDAYGHRLGDPSERMIQFSRPDEVLDVVKPDVTARNVRGG